MNVSKETIASTFRLIEQACNEQVEYDDGGTKILRNVDKLPPDCTASHPRL
jgi:hypothetical protein